MNFNDVNHPLHCKLRYFMESFSLSQVVTGHMHMSYNGHTSLIDLVFLSSPSCLRTCETIPPLGNSDRMGVLTTLVFQRPNLQNPSYLHRKVWCYDLADFSKACRLKLVSCINWNMIFCDNIGLSLLRWYNTFMKVMEECIPTKILPTRDHNIPWLTKAILQAMRRQNSLYKRAKTSMCYQVKLKYRQARIKVVSMLRSSKKRYFEELITSDQKQFWKTVRVLTHQKSTIPTLTLDNEVFSEDCDKARALNAHSPDASTLIFHHCNLSLLHMTRICAQICYAAMKKLKLSYCHWI